MEILLLDVHNGIYGKPIDSRLMGNAPSLADNKEDPKEGNFRKDVVP